MENNQNQKQTFDEVIEELKDNRFFQHKEEIEQFAKENNYDLTVALPAYRAKMGWMDEKAFQEMNEFDSYIGASNQGNQTKAIFDL